MMGGNRFLRVRRVKPDRRQKNKGYQSLLANYYAELALPQLPRHDAPQKAKDRFYVAPSRLTLMTSQARSDSVREARSRRRGRGARQFRRYRPRGPSRGRNKPA